MDSLGAILPDHVSGPVCLHTCGGLWANIVRFAKHLQCVAAPMIVGAAVLAVVSCTTSPPTDGAPGASVTPAAAPPYAAQHQAPRPHLWVLAVGVSDYRDERLRLQYAAADATALVEAFRHQQHSPLYDEVHTQVLVDGEATRERILEGLESFLGGAAPDDVAVVFLAGHGIRTERPVAHYFLTATASAAAPHIAGVDMLEMSRQLQRVHRNIGHLVVILDTCHGGALAEAPADTQYGADLSSALAAAEGLYVLTAARAGEQSFELAQLQHGAFTHALLDGLRGPAADADGFITVFALASHSSRVVQQLTRGKQRPYLAMVGEDVVLAGQPDRLSQLQPPERPARQAHTTSGPARERVAIRSFEHLRPDTNYDWMHKALSQDVLTALGEVPQLDVYDESMLRFVTRDAPDVIEAAQRAGIGMLVEGTYWVQDNQLSVNAQVKSVRPLRMIASARAEGPIDQFSVLTGQLVGTLLRQLPVDVPAALAARLQHPAVTNVTARRLLAEADAGGAPPPAAPGAPRAVVPPEASLQPWVPVHLAAISLWNLGVVRPSWAAQVVDPEAELTATLEAYRQALEAKDLDALSVLYEDFTEGQRAALAQYFANANDLRIQFRDVRVAIIAEDAAVSFTRQDRFTDRGTGAPQKMTVRVTKRFAKRAQGWMIQPGP